MHRKCVNVTLAVAQSVRKKCDSVESIKNNNVGDKNNVHFVSIIFSNGP